MNASIKTKTCTVCNKPFASRYEPSRFCSRKCQGIGITASKQKPCNICGKMFYARPCRVNAGMGKYCSSKCYGVARIEIFNTSDVRWARNTVSKYITLHKLVYKKYGKPEKCDKCGASSNERNIQWANKSNKYIDVDDFIPLCIQCHRKHDQHGFKDRIQRLKI